MNCCGITLVRARFGNTATGEPSYLPQEAIVWHSTVTIQPPFGLLGKTATLTRQNVVFKRRNPLSWGAATSQTN